MRELSRPDIAGDIPRCKKIIFIVAVFVICCMQGEAQIIETFNYGELSAFWSATSDSIELTQENHSLRLQCNQAGGYNSDDAVTLFFIPFNFSSGDPELQIILKADMSVNLQLDLLQISGEDTLHTNALPVTISLSEDSVYAEYSFDFTGRFSQLLPEEAEIDSTQIAGLMIYINKYGSAVSGTIDIDQVIIGDVNSGLHVYSIWVEDFDNNITDNIEEVSSVFSIDETDGELAVEVDNAGGEGYYDNFIMNLPKLNLASYPVLQVDIKTSKECTIRIDLQEHQYYWRNNPVTTNADPVEIEILGDGQYHTYTFDFTGKFSQTWPDESSVDSTSIGSMLVYINPDGDLYSGTLYFDNLVIGEERSLNTAPFISPIPYFELTCGEDFEAFDLSPYVDDDFTPDESIYWYTSTSDHILPTVVNSVLMLEFYDEDWYGTEYVIFYAQDYEGLTDSIAVKFTVAAPAGSALPELDNDEVGFYYDYSDEVLIVSNAEDKNFYLQIFSLGGTVLSSEVLYATDNKLRISVEHLPPGCYPARLVSGETYYTTKIIKK